MTDKLKGRVVMLFKRIGVFILTLFLTIVILFFRPELIPWPIKGIIGGITVGLTTFLISLEFGFLGSPVIIIAILAALSIFLYYYHINKEREGEPLSNTNEVES